MKNHHRYGLVALGTAALTSVLLLILFGTGVLRTPRAAPKRSAWEFAIDDGTGPGAPRPTVPTSTGGELTGVVVDTHGREVGGATVVLVGREDRTESREDLLSQRRIVATDDQGGFSFDRRAGAARIVVRHPDYVTARHDFEPGPENAVRIVLRRGLQVRGRVISARGETAVAGIRVVARGVGADAAAGRPDLVPQARARIRVAVSGPNGEFEFRGMEPGSYQVEAVAPGLTSVHSDVEILDAAWAFTAGRRAVVAQAGQAEAVVLRVLPVAAAILKVESETGGLVPNPSVALRLGPNLLPWTKSLLPDRDVVIANGHMFDGRREALPGGTQVLLCVGQRWPIPDSHIEVTIYATGFMPTTAQVPVRPLTTEFGVPTVIRMRPEGPRGEVVFKTVDGHGNAVGPLADMVLLDPIRDGVPALAKVKVSSAGLSDPISIAVGTYVVKPLADQPVAWTSKALVVRADAKTRATLTLSESLLKLRVVDETERTLAGVGLKLGRGHEQIHVDHQFDGRILSVSGLFQYTPGLGELPDSALRLASGPWTVELYCPGYEPSRAMVECRPGEQSELLVKMRERPEGTWDAWSKTPRTRLDEVLGLAAGK